MRNPFTKFGKAKSTLVTLGFFLIATVIASFHEDIFIGKRDNNQPTSTISGSTNVSTNSGGEQTKSGRLWDLTEKLLITICAVLIIHLLDQVYLMDDFIQNTKDALDTVVERQIRLIGSSAKCGIADIYVNRQAARKDIMDDISEARERIWLLGVGLNVRVNLKGLVPTLRDKKSAGVDVRILMLDAFRSTALFRTLLESTAEQAERIITYYEDLHKHGVSDPRAKDVYFSATLCNEFESTCRTLQNTPELEACVKFYAHTPICWLVMTHNKAYFQPYTFGSLTRQEGSQDSDIHDTHTTDETIGDLLPIFKFQSHKNVETFKILQDHFLKLWATSDCSLFHLQARQNDKEGILRRIFDTRREWLRHVYNVLYTARGKKSYDKKPGEIVLDDSGKKEPYRLYERQICAKPVKVVFKLSGQKNLFSGEILDSSREGLAIVTRQSPGSSVADEAFSASVGMHIEVKLEETERSTREIELPNLTEFLRQILLDEKNSFEIRSLEPNGRNDEVRVGLKKVA